MSKRKKRLVTILVLACIALVSIFWLGRILSSPEFYSGMIRELNEKRNAAMSLSAMATATAATLSMVSEGAAESIGSQMMQLTTWLLIVTCVIILEKFLLTLLPYIVFTFVIPTACMVLAVCQFKQYTAARDFAIKLIAFGLAIVAVIPAGVLAGQVVEKTYKASIAVSEETIGGTVDKGQQTEQDKAVVEQQVAQEEAVEENWFITKLKKAKAAWNKAVNAVEKAAEKTVATVQNLVETAQTVFWTIVEGIAVMLVTTLIIPLLVAVILLRIIEKIFAIDLKPLEKLLAPKMKNKKTEASLVLTE